MNTDKTFTVSVDGDEFEIPRKGNTPASILTAAGIDPTKRYLIEIKGNNQTPYRDHPNEEIQVHQNQQFVTGSLDPIPVS